MKKLFALILTFCILITSMCFFVSAEDVLPFFTIGVQFSNDNENYGSTYWITPDGVFTDQGFYRYYKIVGFQLSYGGLTPQEVWITFNSGCISNTGLVSGTFENSWSQYNNNNKPGKVYASPTSTTVSNNATWFCAINRGNIPLHALDTTNAIGTDYVQWNVRVKPLSTFAVNSNARTVFYLDSPIYCFNTYVSQTYSFCPYIHGFSYFLNSLSFFNSILSTTNNSLNSISSLLSTQNTYLQGLWNFENSLNSSNYSWLSHSVSSTGHISISQQTGSWYDAIIGSLNTLTSDFALQIEMQNQAVSGGAETALSSAWAQVGNSFTSLSTITDLGDLATWSSSLFDEKVSYNITSWFSQQVADQIDSVPRNRDSQLDIVDFYSSNLSEILDAFGGDSSVSSTSD